MDKSSNSTSSDNSSGGGQHAAGAAGNSSNSADTQTHAITAASQSVVGCGTKSAAATATTCSVAASLAAAQQLNINLNISTTTGGNFSVSVDPAATVEQLKKLIGKRLKVAKDRICLLHREKELHDGTLRENSLMDGSKIILIPNVETGLLAQRPENTVMQALESLNDSQVNDFLSGKTPLNLSMRLGDHMMLIQLQLSTVNPANALNGGAANCSASRTRSSHQRFSSRSSQSNSSSGVSNLSSNNNSAHHQNSHHSHHAHHHHQHNHQTNLTTTNASSSNSTSSNLTTDNARKSSSEMNAANNTTTATCQRSNLAVSNRPATTTAIKASDLTTFLSKRDIEQLQSLVKTIAMSQPAAAAVATRLSNKIAAAQMLQNNNNNDSNTTTTQQAATTITIPKPSSTSATANFQTTAASSTAPLLEQSPIMSLSNLVSSPIKTTAIQHIPIVTHGNKSSSTSAATAAAAAATASAVASACQDPIAANLTSCLCKRLNNRTKSCCNLDAASCPLRPGIYKLTTTPNGVTRAVVVTPSANNGVINHNNNKNSSTSAAALLHKTVNNPISRSKHRHHHHYHQHQHSAGSSASTSSSSSNSSNALNAPIQRVPVPFVPRAVKSNHTAANEATVVGSTAFTPTTTNKLPDSSIVISDTRTLAEASRNLTQTLRKLSKEVFTNKIDLSTGEETPRKSSTGAVIESMKNHGKGIYSGTFSGTLNPALQDRYGRPKRDISTVIHILNDLLSATPQYSRGARISFEAPSTSAAASIAAAGSATGVHLNAAHSSRCKQLLYKHHQQQQSNCAKCIKAVNQQQQSNQSSSCTFGECIGHYTNRSNATHRSYNSQEAADGSRVLAEKIDRNVCCCRYSDNSLTGERERVHMCQKCLVEMENQKTKTKMDHLRLVMQQRKQKREARKLKGAPYGARVVGTTTAAALNDAAAATFTLNNTATSNTLTNSKDVVATTTAANNSNNSNSATLSSATTPMTTTSTSQPSEVSPNHIVEEVDTAA